MNPVHGRAGLIEGLDRRSLLLALLAVTACVISHGKYELLALLPYAAFPILLLASSGPGAAPWLKRLAWVVPLAGLVGLANPWLDRTPRLLLPGLALPGGWISLAGILVRCLVLVGSALAVGRLVPPAELLPAARRLGLPRALGTVLLFLGRYLEVLLEEGRRVRRARLARAAGTPGWRSAGGAGGNLFLRSLDRAERIHRAMRARGFTGELPAGRAGRFGAEEWAFLALAAGAALGWRLLSPGLLPFPEVAA